MLQTSNGCSTQESSTTMNSNDTTKTCTKCGKEYPATTEYFHKHSKNILRSRCKSCVNSENNQYSSNNRDKLRENAREYYQANRSEILKKSKEYNFINRDKIKIYMQDWYIRNKQHHSEIGRAWRIKNAQHIRERRRKYREENYYTIRSREIAYQNAHKEQSSARSKKWQIDNPEKVKEAQKHYYERNRERCLLRAFRRRMKYKENGGFTKEQIETLLEAQGYRCMYCGINIKHRPTIDHHIPISSGGGNEITNIVMACKFCNSSKGNKHPFKWFKMREFV